MEKNYLNVWLSLLAAVSTFILFYPFASIGVDFHHDGVILKPAFDVSTGQVLFRDSFTQYGALSTYLHAVCLQILPGLLSIRLLTVFAYSVTVFFLFSCWLLISPRSVAVLGLLLFWLMAPFYDKRWLLLPWPSVVALVFQSMSAYFLFKTILNRKNYIWPTLLGLCIGFTFWARPITVGVGLVFSVLAFFVFINCIKKENKSILSFNHYCVVLFSFFLANLCFVIPIFLNGLFPLWLDQQFLWPSRGYSSGNLWGSSWLQRLLGELRPLDGLKVAGLFILYCAPYFLLKMFRADCKQKKKNLLIHFFCMFCILVIVLYCFPGFLLFAEGWSGKPGGVIAFFCIVFVCGSAWMLLPLLKGLAISTDEILVYALVFISTTSLFQFYPTFSLPQLFWSLAPICGLISCFIWRFCRFNAAIALSVSIALLFPSLIQRTFQVLDNLSRPFVKIEKPSFLAGMRVDPKMADLIKDIELKLQETLFLQPEKPISVIGDDAMYCLFANNQANQTPYYVTWDGLMPTNYAASRLELIQVNRPIVVFCSSLMEVDNRTVDEFKLKYGYQEIFYIPYQPAAWWYGGQNNMFFSATTVSGKASARFLIPN